MTDETLLERQCAAGGQQAESPAQKGSQVEHFGDPGQEYAAAQTTAALFDVSDRSQLELTGTDRHKFLHNFCTNQVKELAPGTGCEAFVTNIKGRVLAHIFIFAGEQSLWIESTGGIADSLAAHLDRYLITEDVEIHNRSNDLGELFISGPHAAQKLAQQAIPADQLADSAHRQLEIGGATTQLRRVDLLGTTGFLLSAPRAQLPGLWSYLKDKCGFTPAGAAAFDALRIEAALPIFGVDITEDNLAQEVARTQQAISFTKGCYLGQEPIARIDALGHVNRELCRLSFDGPAVPAAGTTLLTADGTKEIGTITSAAKSFGKHPVVALAYLRSAHTKPNTEVAVQIDDQQTKATVMA